MEKIIIQILVLLIFWFIVNTILKTLLYRSKNNNNGYEIQSILENFSSAVLTYRKTIAFNIIVLLILYFLNIEFLFIIAIIYYIIIAIIEGILIIKSFTTELNYPGNKIIINELWLSFLAKLFNEISNIIIIFTFWNLV